MEDVEGCMGTGPTPLATGALAERPDRCAVAQDSLPPVAQYVDAVLGASHPVAAEMQLLAVANLSAAARAQQAERQRLVEVRLPYVLSEHVYIVTSTVSVSSSIGLGPIRDVEAAHPLAPFLLLPVLLSLVPSIVLAFNPLQLVIYLKHK